MQDNCAVRMRDITKRFGSTVANNKAWLDIRRGEILSLLGENGSGKTTLMNMLSGIYYPDEGHIYVGDKEVSIRSPKDAFDLGIGMIHQHFKLVDVLSAAENVILGLKESRLINIEKVKVRIKEICDRYGFVVDPDRMVYDMSVSEKQTLEIVKVLYRGADILILDEPTAVLTPQETTKLFDVMRNMKADGKAVVIITHKLNEVMEIADRVAVLRKGCFVGDMLIKDTNPQEMTNMMMGHAVTLNIERPDPVDPKPRIVAENITVVDNDGVTRLNDVSFTAYTGEILGIAGISGSGQKELLETIAGLQRAQGGSVKYINDNGTEEELLGRDPLAIASMGVALSFVPEDRLGMGLVGSMDITDNMLLRSFRRGHHFFADRKTPRELAEKVVAELEVNTPGISTPVSKLSGGNVQKILVGREIADNPTVLMTAYAVRGLDINSSYTIYDLINEQKRKGVAVIFVGEDLDVLLELCDKILVMCSGRVSGIVDARTTTKEEVGLLMTTLNGGEER